MLTKIKLRLNFKVKFQINLETKPQAKRNLHIEVKIQVNVNKPQVKPSLNNKLFYSLIGQGPRFCKNVSYLDLTIIIKHF